MKSHVKDYKQLLRLVKAELEHPMLKSVDIQRAVEFKDGIPYTVTNIQFTGRADEKDYGTGKTALEICEGLIGLGEPDEGGTHTFNSYGFCYWCGKKEKLKSPGFYTPMDIAPGEKLK